MKNAHATEKLVFKSLISLSWRPDEACTPSSMLWAFRVSVLSLKVLSILCNRGSVGYSAHDNYSVWNILDVPIKSAGCKNRMVHQLTPAVQWRCCRKNGNYPYNHTVEPCHSLVRINCIVQRWFNYPNTSVESDRGHIQGRSSCYRSSNYRLDITPLLAKNPSPYIQACYPKGHVQQCHGSVSQCQVVDWIYTLRFWAWNLYRQHRGLINCRV